MFFQTLIADWRGAILEHPRMALVFFFSIILTSIFMRISRTDDSLPPSPPGWPLIGNLPEILKSVQSRSQHLLLAKWAEQHGEIFRMRSGPVTEYIVNSDTAVRFIFDKNSSATAERPVWTTGKTHITGGMSILLLDGSTARWKNHRRLLNLNITSVQRANSALPHLYDETLKFIYEVAHEGTKDQKLYEALGRLIYSTFTRQIFGLKIPNNESPSIIHLTESGEREIESTIPCFYIADIFTTLHSLPDFLKPWTRAAKKQFNDDIAWGRDKLSRTKKMMANGNCPDVFMARLLEDESLMGCGSEEEAAYLSMQAIIGGSDTSRLTVWAFLEAMMLYPEIQSKAQELVDGAVGNRLPVFEDLENLPYVRYIMKEIWRWRPFALGQAHTSTRDIEYKGYKIPKGETMRINTWAIGHDSRRHADPERFFPERWEGDLSTTAESANSPDATKRDHFAFGAGRRICPGVHVADRNVSVVIMRLLWAFHARPPVGGLPKDPAEYAAQLPGPPGPGMPVSLEVRSREKALLIDDLYEAGKGEFEHLLPTD